MRCPQPRADDRRPHGDDSLSLRAAGATLALLTSLVFASLASSAPLVSGPPLLLSAGHQAHIVADDWWCAVVPVISTNAPRATSPECGSWDSGAVQLNLDVHTDLGDPNFTVPLWVSSYTRAR